MSKYWRKKSFVATMWQRFWPFSTCLILSVILAATWAISWQQRDRRNADIDTINQQREAQGEQRLKFDDPNPEPIVTDAEYWENQGYVCEGALIFGMPFLFVILYTTQQVAKRR
jgi:hypothetical protein